MPRGREKGVMSPCPYLEEGPPHLTPSQGLGVPRAAC